MKTQKILKVETNSTIYRRYRKLWKAACPFCPWHRKENRSKTDNRCWKNYRNAQWK